ncbi:MAG: hypothetical protein WBK26_12975 [Burkholderiaceae bacterium]
MATYNYKARELFRLPVFEHVMHKPKCKTDSWLYVAVPADAALSALGPYDRLYVGSQTADRMFRGDGLGGNNFHHAQMRAGNGSDNPIQFLQSGRQITIHRISAKQIAHAVEGRTELAAYRPLLRHPGKHVGYWFEQAILHSEPQAWRWNTASADKQLRGILAI